MNKYNRNVHGSKNIKIRHHLLINLFCNYRLKQ